MGCTGVIVGLGSGRPLTSRAEIKGISTGGERTTVGVRVGLCSRN
jgi:hypothetical protein